MPVIEETATAHTHPRAGRVPVVSGIIVVILIKLVALFAIISIVQAYLPGDYNAKKFGWDGYDQIAWNLSQGHGYRVYPDASPTMLRTPGFPLVLAILFVAFGKSLFAVQVVNLTLSCITGFLVYRLAVQTGLTAATGVVGALIFALYPGVIVAESRCGPESLLMFCLVASVLSTNVAVASRTWYPFVRTGVLVGITILVTPTLAVVIPALLLYRVWHTSHSQERRRVAAGTVICGLACLLVMTPWILRNYRLSRTFQPTMTVSGLAAFEGNYIINNLQSHRQLYEVLADAADEQIMIAQSMGLQMHGGQEYGVLDFTDKSGWQFFPQFFKAHDEVVFYRELGRRALDDYRAKPRLILQGVMHNSWAFWAAGKTTRATILNAILVCPLLLLSAVGFRMGIRKKTDQFVVILLAAMLPYLVIIAEARYYIPVVPFLAILAAIPVADGLRKARLPALNR
jgi:hypothetical protein